eukprot:Skav215822  [mRNA]  locus=scaffold3449:216288:216701:- [translate_table: standard]
MKRSLQRVMGQPNVAKQPTTERPECHRSGAIDPADGDRSDIARALHELGEVKWDAGDLRQAKRLFEESLQISRSLHAGDPPIAATLHALGQMSLDAGHLKLAKQQLEECLQLRQEIHGVWQAHPETATTLHDLGLVN